MRLFRLALMSAVMTAASASFASQIIFTFQAIATGSVGGVAFHDASFEIQVGTDPSQVTYSGGVYTNGVQLAFVSIDGFRTGGLITTPIEVFDDNNTSVLGLRRVSNSVELFDVGSSAFANYDLAHGLVNISVTGPNGLGYFSCKFGCISTTLGDLEVDSMDSIQFSLSIEETQAPEPASLTLLGSAILGVGGLRVAMGRWVRFGAAAHVRPKEGRTLRLRSGQAVGHPETF